MAPCLWLRAGENHTGHIGRGQRDIERLGGRARPVRNRAHRTGATHARVRVCLYATNAGDRCRRDMYVNGPIGVSLRSLEAQFVVTLGQRQREFAVFVGVPALDLVAPVVALPLVVPHERFDADQPVPIHRRGT
jgi:hypothetical protein